MSERTTRREPWSEKSAEAVVVARSQGNEGLNDEKSATDVSLGSKRPQMSRADGSSPERRRG
jgi:hypothetical protein